MFTMIFTISLPDGFIQKGSNKLLPFLGKNFQGRNCVIYKEQKTI